MNRRSTTSRLAVVAVISALALAACGSEDDGEPTASDSSASSTSSTSTSDAPTSEATTDDAPVAQGDGTLTFGDLLPQTGSLAFLGPPEFAGVDLAVKDIEDSGVDIKVKNVRGDSGDTDSGIAPAETDKLLAAGADVIVGAASSGVSLTVIDKIMSAGSVMFSPANTSTSFDEGDYAQPDNYFRTAPSDILQGAVLANLLLQDGRQNVAIMARQDAYGETLAEQVKMNLEAAGSTVATTVFYGEKAQNFDSQVQEVAGSGADALVLIAFDETTSIIPQLVSANFGPQDVPTYFVDGNTASYAKDSSTPLPDGVLLGVKGTIPGAETTGDFQKRLLTVNPKLDDFSYSAESYDAVIVSALASLVAGSDAGDAIAKEIPGVTKDGEKCTDFKACADLIAAGTDIDYDGVSGPIELGETGSPTAASIGIYEYGKDNTYKAVDYISGNI